MDKSSGKLIQKSLSEGLELPSQGYAIFKDYVTNLEYIRPCKELTGKGLFILLGEYQCHVFLDWRFTSGNDENWEKVAAGINGAGIPSVQTKYEEMFSKVSETTKKSIRKPRKELEKKKPIKKLKSSLYTTKKV